MKTFPAREKIYVRQRKNIPRKFALKHSQPGRKISLEKNSSKKYS